MKTHFLELILPVAVLGLLVPMTAQAAPGQASATVSSQLSPQRLDMLDRRGYFTPAFKKAIHDLVDVKKELVEAKATLKKLEDEVPDLQRQVATAGAKTEDLQKQLFDLEHTDESEFTELQKKMGAEGTPLEEERILTQSYVWAYPASPHLADAQSYLQEIQKKIADQAKAAADAEAARVAARAKLVQRAQARDLSVSEWRDFLLSMSKEDLIKFMGRPQKGSLDEWSYTDEWTEDPLSHKRVGLEVMFNAGRVINVTMAPH